MATKIVMAEALANTLINARYAYDPKAARKAAWSTIRERLNLPTGIRLKAEVDNSASGDYLVLKCADTGNYLWRTADGGVQVSATAPTVSDPAPQAARVPTGSRFAATAGSAATVLCISVDDLVRVLRDEDGDEHHNDYIRQPAQLPAGFPGVTGNGVVLDTTERVLYFAG